MVYLYALTGLLLFISLLASREKTIKALQIAWKKFYKIMPAFLKMLIFVSILLFLFPDKVIVNYLGGENLFKGTLLASLIGSLTLMPGFIVFPLCGILLKKGVSYMILAAFATSLMMVGVLTYPIEKEYFGIKITLIRNVLSYAVVLVIALIIGLFYGEVTI